MMRKLLAAFTTLLSILAFYEVVISPIHGIIKFVICAVLLFLCGMSLQKLLNLNGEKGLLILSTERGKKSLDRIARWNPEFWRGIATFGMVMGFGASSAMLFGQAPNRTFKISMLVLMLSTLFVLPSVLPVAREIIQLPATLYGVQAAVASQPSAIGMLLYYGVFFCILIGGFSLSGVISFAGYGLIILYSILMKLLSLAGSSIGNAGALSAITPGAMPIIPGINLPFAEGVLSLAVLLFFHEVSHGILARVEKIRVKNSGLVLFGFLPIGAFVEPDEKQLQKSDAEKQKNVLAAGSSANLIISIIFFILFLVYYFTLFASNPPPTYFFKEHVMVYSTVQGYPAYGILKSGMIIKEWDGVQINSLDDFSKMSNLTEPNRNVTIKTDAGVFSIKADKNGKIGISVLAFTNSTATAWVREISSVPGNWWIGFLYNFIGLTFVLNFLVGSVNLLPIPPFDGYRIVSLAVKNEKIMKVLSFLMILFFVLNLLPWTWQ